MICIEDERPKKNSANAPIEQVNERAIGTCRAPYRCSDDLENDEGKMRDLRAETKSVVLALTAETPINTAWSCIEPLGQ